MSATCKNHPERNTFGDRDVCLACHRIELDSTDEAKRARVANANETARLPIAKLRKLAAARGLDVANEASVADLVEIITGARPADLPADPPASETPADSSSGDGAPGETPADSSSGDGAPGETGATPPAALARPARAPKP